MARPVTLTIDGQEVKAPEGATILVPRDQITTLRMSLASEGLPARVVSLVRDEATRGNCLSPTHQGIAIIARKIADYDRDRLRWDLVPSDVSDTMYPKPG